MSAYPVQIDLPDYVLGDRWEGIGSIGPVLVNGVTPAGALERVRMQLVKAGGSGGSYDLDSDSGATPDAPITITNAATWVVSIPKVQNFLPSAGKWNWAMKFYEAGNSAPITLYKGEISVTTLP